MGGIVEVVGWIVIGFVIVVIVAILYAIPVYFLWNWLLPRLFGITKITLLESLGLLLLTGLLFRSSSSSKK